MLTINYLTDFQLNKTAERQIKDWLSFVITKENKITGDIHYIFCDDEQLLSINQKFLQHDTYTDIITFPTSSQQGIISGEIYVSITRVTENAKSQQVPFYDELNRVSVHGVLHLLGYEDHTPDEKKEMRSKEDYYLTLRP